MDFWGRYDVGYRLFSQFCSPSDWHTILKMMAGELRKTDSIASGISGSFLDVGAGTGINTGALLEIIYAAQGVRHFLSVVEPSPIARERLMHNLVQVPEGGFLRRVYESTGQLRRERFDSIVFMHSSYYIPRFDNVLQNLIEHNLRARGRVVILALPPDSPFFLERQPALSNLSSDIVDIARRSSWRFDLTRLKSHWYLPTGLSLPKRSIQHLHRFICDQTDIGYEEFCGLLGMLKSRYPPGVDLGDQMITITP